MGRRGVPCIIGMSLVSVQHAGLQLFWNQTQDQPIALQ